MNAAFYLVAFYELAFYPAAFYECSVGTPQWANMLTFFKFHGGHFIKNHNLIPSTVNGVSIKPGQRHALNFQTTGKHIYFIRAPKYIRLLSRDKIN